MLRGPRENSAEDPKSVELALKEAAEDVFRYVIGRPDAIRQRAQFSATVAGVVAAAITVACFRTSAGSVRGDRPSPEEREGGEEAPEDALAATFVATGLTVIGVAGAAFDAERRDEPVTAEVWLTDDGAEAVKRLCRTEFAHRRIRGRVSVVDLVKPAVSVRIHERKLTLRSRDVLGTRKLADDAAHRPACPPPRQAGRG